MKKYLRFTVYRYTADCTNGGVSSTNDTLYVEAEPHDTKGFLMDPPSNLIFRRDRMRDGYCRLIAVNRPKGEWIGPMAGGNIAMMDKDETAWHIHDRFETDEQYRLLSM